MGIWHRFEAIWLAQRGALFPWVPVGLACGVGTYFALLREPSVAALWGCGGAALCSALLAARGREWSGPLLWTVALVLAGFALAGLRAHLVAGPVLGWRYYGPVEGRIVGIDRSASDALRLTLDRVVLERTDPARMPGRVRVSLHGDQSHFMPLAGQRVMMTAHLGPAGGPVEPGGFDFQRHAWFLGIGAVGYTRTPVLRLEAGQGGQPLFRARMALSQHVQSRLPGQTGAFAAAIMTGDRAGLSLVTLEAMRVSNLAHLLAISGLHMGLLAGFVFAAFRLGFAAVPRLGLRLPAKKLSAFLALVAGAGYLGLSGGNVATERAFVMVAVMLGAVILERRAFSLRAVAVAAIIVLVLQPEALLGPGFQMSFAATVGLVAVFGWLRDAGWSRGPRWLRPVLAVVISSAVAGAATAPVAAAHFNQYAQFGLLANLVSVPLMGVLVMPAAVLATLLLPLGLDWIALRVMELGLRWILTVADWVAALDGARVPVVAPGPYVLPLLALGALFIVLWQGRGRILGVLPVMVAVALWGAADRPVMIVSDTGGLIGIMTEAGRALNKPTGGGFVADNWLENDGDDASREVAFARWSEDLALAHGVRVMAGKAATDMPDFCDGVMLVVMSVTPDPPPAQHRDCQIVTPETLRKTGSLALHLDKAGPRLVSARDTNGVRLWNSQ
ncbi:competence protein [Roseovarius sp. TM1035]|uniref:ComEC/Rec2 family competence protein n=1 Tax=Roseovarius sp. TM1035 TaxID=391613 RepID=UPI0001557163|nr:ComEC/Rec2 family competence protein [Roseovarius sp. TM1035]AWZ22081.1 DNA internalization-related competence protein ComEC/Rec2 [Roseovarius sp. AK1035]EDM29822.1 competence protein [Roseovarius sp. TM1035]